MFLAHPIPIGIKEETKKKPMEILSSESILIAFIFGVFSHLFNFLERDLAKARVGLGRIF